MLKSLVNYYEHLLARGVEGIARPGWSTEKIVALVDVAEDGSLVSIIPAEEKNGWTRQVPKRVVRSSGVKPNLLCDTSSYIFGADAKGKPQRAVECFEAMRESNIAFLESVDSGAARAVRAFFERWNPEDAEENPALAACKDLVLAGGNLAFSFQGREILSDGAIVEAVEKAAVQPDADDEVTMRCLVTGERAPIARIHPKIKKLAGAQSAGAALVSFNDRSSESYGHNEDQGLNAPVSEYAAFAYTAALNYLLADPLHHIRIGDTTIVYWSLEDDEVRSTLFRESIEPGFSLDAAFADDAKDEEKSPAAVVQETDKALDFIMTDISKGRLPDDLKLGVPFFVMGLDPNAARVSVRFYMQDSLEAFLGNISKHYERMKIAHGPYQSDYLPIYRIAKEVENPNAKKGVVSSMLAGSLLRAILSDASYPAMLYQNALLRTRATQDNEERRTRKVSYARAAIIKACLIKNYGREDITVDVNTENQSVPNLLGRLFGLYEATQGAAAYMEGRKLNSTIVSRYFNSACATPGVAFPEIGKLNMKHLDKLGREGRGAAYARQIGELYEAIGRQTGTFPARLTVEEQGDFILGYWCQRQSMFNTKADDKADEEA